MDGRQHLYRLATGLTMMDQQKALGARIVMTALAEWAADEDSSLTPMFQELVDDVATMDLVSEHPVLVELTILRWMGKVYKFWPMNVRRPLGSRADFFGPRSITRRCHIREMRRAYTDQDKLRKFYATCTTAVPWQNDMEA